MLERRAVPRSATLIAAHVVVAERTIDCTVRDLSSAGARISCSAAAELPEEFELHLPTRGRAHRVRVRWQIGRDVGVSFEAAVPLRGTRALAG